MMSTEVCFILQFARVICLLFVYCHEEFGEQELRCPLRMLIENMKQHMANNSNMSTSKCNV